MIPKGKKVEIIYHKNKKYLKLLKESFLYFRVLHQPTKEIDTYYIEGVYDNGRSSGVGSFSITQLKVTEDNDEKTHNH